MVDGQGTILSAATAAGESWDPDYLGEGTVLCPGFINAHTHLELSWMHGRIEKGLGLDHFIRSVAALRREIPVEAIRQAAMQSALNEMLVSGTVAAGDIANGLSGLELKREKEIRWHTFIELFGSHEGEAEDHFRRGMELRAAFRDMGDSSLVPHAPYSVSVPLLDRILAQAGAEQAILSMHHQENPAETEYYLHGSGPVALRLEDMGIPLPPAFPAGRRPLEFILSRMPVARRLLLVHNTYATAEDMEAARGSATPLSWVLCPRANLYIEGRLPDVELLMQKGAEIALGTDSLASNDDLSMVQEMKVLQAHFPWLTLDTLIPWATLHGARALGMEQELGSLQPGKRPGLLCLDGIVDGRIGAGTRIRRLG